MPIPAVPNGVARVSYEGRYGVSHWVNVFWVQVTGAASADATDMDDLADDLYAAYATHLQPLAPLASHLEHCKVVLRSSGSDLLNIHSEDTAGAVTGDDLPAQVARLLSWNIGTSYRGGHPRTYLAAATYTQLDGVTELNGTTIANLNSGAALFRTAVNAITTTHLSAVMLGTLSRFTAGGSTATPKVYRDPPVFMPFTGVHAQPRICTQRRRLGSEI